jgi:short-chain fatty acids transporter
MTKHGPDPEKEPDTKTSPDPASPGARPDESTWVDVLGKVMERWVPDALTTAIVLMVALIGLSLFAGGTVMQTLDGYYEGLWMFLRFTMQMTLILVLSLMVSATPFFRNLVAWISRFPRTRVQVITLAALCVGGVAYLNWGLALALAPVIAIHFCREAERKNIPVDFLFLLAIVAGAGSIWQFGLSASAPLVMATPGQELVQDMGVMPLRTTIWSVAAIVHVVAFMLATITVGCWLMPKRVRPISEFADSMKVADAAGPSAEAVQRSGKPASPAERVERSSWVLLPLALMLVAWLYLHFFVKHLSVDINSVNTTLLLLAVVLHRTVANFQQALRDAIKLSWPVVVLYHLYAGVAGLIQFTPVGEFLVSAVAPISTPYTYPLLTAMISTVVAIFIPTSGGQWAIQGSVTSAAAEAVGLTAQRGLLALSVGDHMGNLLTPFWAVLGANIARVDFRLLFGYRLIFAALWFVIGVLCFTFLPC